MTSDRLEIFDPALHFEIELLGQVVAAAALATAHLTDEQVDAALEVHGAAAHLACEAVRPSAHGVFRH